MKQLTAYYKFSTKAGWKDQDGVAVDRMKQLIRRQLGLLFEQKAAWTVNVFRTIKGYELWRNSFLEEHFASRLANAF
jgi:hypothetical protein